MKLKGFKYRLDKEKRAKSKNTEEKEENLILINPDGENFGYIEKEIVEQRIKT